MDLLQAAWITTRHQDGTPAYISPSQVGDAEWIDLISPRPDFRGALYQFLIGLLQTAYAPQDLGEWKERWASPPSVKELEAVFAPYRHAFLLENDGPAFMQDLQLPEEVNQLPVRELLIDAGSSSNLFFNKPPAEEALCESCATQALLALQLNAPSGGRGIRTSLRGGGPMTTLLLPASETSTLWQKLWLNVLPLEELDHPPLKKLSDVLPWLAPTRTSDEKGVGNTPPESVHPLQAYWSMPRRIRLDSATLHGACSVCGIADVRLIQHYRTRHGGTNYTDAWTHPLTPYSIDPKGEKPPLSTKGQRGGIGYRHWLGLTLGREDRQPDAAQVMRHFSRRIKRPQVRLWCFGYDMDNMKARCWYDSTLPVHAVPDDLQRLFSKNVNLLLEVANACSSALHKQVKAAWFRRPGDVGGEPAVPQSFWEGSEALFYEVLATLSELDFEQPDALARVYRRWLLGTRKLALELFDQWVLSGPVEAMDLQRVVKARADLAKELNSGKAMKPLWTIVNQHHKEQA